MSEASGDVGKPLLVSLIVVWGCAAVAFLAIQWLLDSYLAAGRGDEFGLSMMMTTPGDVVIYAVLLSLLFLLHWWLSGLFGKSGIASRPVANLMLVAAGLCILQLLFEGATRDYLEFSVLCGPDEPTVVIMVDEFYLCERSMLVTKAAGWLSIVLPLLAIPVRILESRVRMKRT
ncbi:hypothetical protein GRI43_02980 [Altererythrobacter luteolus]|uniref:Uncharacterized protein n=1 Tax=Pontixanthobacter luteolus TaxID=295089 RepID=A0A6I4UXK1_9SPHN|nr:hypothetical protein [Pontixanthobacter luteolus]MXP46358.1 hypothetical protein [Pontixanthobacter luteolus]